VSDILAGRVNGGDGSAGTAGGVAMCVDLNELTGLVFWRVELRTCT
jgi:hypothetical protein